MSNVEAIKKALEGVTPDRLRYEADAMFAAVQGERHGYTLHARNWADKPHRVLNDAISLMRDAAATLEALQRENYYLRELADQMKTEAHTNAAECHAANYRVKFLEEALKPFSTFSGVLFERNFNNNDFVAGFDDVDGVMHTICAGPFFNSRTALASAGEHHAE